MSKGVLLDCFVSLRLPRNDHTRLCEERSDEAIQNDTRNEVFFWIASVACVACLRNDHTRLCEERSDEAIQAIRYFTKLLRWNAA